MNGLIIYKSKYGATKKYANWLSEETGFPLVDVENANTMDIRSYNTIILGGGIHASGIQGLSFIKKHFDILKDKNIVVFCVGASPYDEKAFNIIRESNMKEKLKNIPLFYCRGAWNINSMTFIDRTMCQILRKSIAKKPVDRREPWMNALLEAGDSATDWTDRSYILPILELLNKI